jgi:hypothetical protein
MKKYFLFTLVMMLVTFVAVGFIYFEDRKSDKPVSGYQQLEPNQGTDIGKSWNPPRSSECATIINAVASVQVDNTYTNQNEIEAKIIENTKLAAARLSVLAQKSLDRDIAAWSYKAALLLVQFPQAIQSQNQTAVASLYDEIGKMVTNPPKTCDNTLNSAA